MHQIALLKFSLQSFYIKFINIKCVFELLKGAWGLSVSGFVVN